MQKHFDEILKKKKLIRFHENLNQIMTKKIVEFFLESKSIVDVNKKLKNVLQKNFFFAITQFRKYDEQN